MIERPAKEGTIDDLTPLLDELRIATTLFGIADLPRDWGVEFPQGQGAYFHVLDGGQGWLQLDQHPPMHVDDGDVVLLAQGTAHKVTSAREGVPLVRFDPVVWRPNEINPAVGPDSSPGRTTLVCGAVEARARPRHLLLDLLPNVFHVPAHDPTAHHVALAVRLLRDEASATRPGRRALLARLGDVLLIQLIRAWLERDETIGSGWLAALHDPHLGQVLVAIHSDLAAPWTLQSMADIAHLSRSRFAEQFTHVVGAPPMTYLTRRRLERAHALLDDGRTIREISRAVGYASEQSFSRAFTRYHGVPPSRSAQAPNQPLQPRSPSLDCP